METYRVERAAAVKTEGMVVRTVMERSGDRGDGNSSCDGWDNPSGNREDSDSNSNGEDGVSSVDGGDGDWSPGGVDCDVSVFSFSLCMSRVICFYLS